MEKRKIIFEGIDFWGRPVYKQVNSDIRFGSTSKLVPSGDVNPNGTIQEINDYFRENILELCYFGTEFDCEPMGGSFGEEELEIIDEMVAIAVIDLSNTTLTIYDVPDHWDSDLCEDFLIKKNHRMSEISWGAFDGIINDEREN